MRTGLIAEKLGMTRVFSKDGHQIPITLLRIHPNIVLEIVERKIKNNEEEQHIAIKLGSVRVTKIKNLKKPLKGYFDKLNIEPQKIIREFCVSSKNIIDAGSILDASHFQSGQLVDIKGTTIGKGFAGPMKRHGFSGLRASHGVSVSHRSHGSTGNRQDPGKVFKNKKMAGHMGNKKRTQQNLKIYAVDSKEGLVYIQGSVPGIKGGILIIQDSIKNKFV